MEEDIVIHADGDDVILEDYPADCCPDPCYKKFPILAGDDDSPFWQGWANLRLKTFQLIENKYFETAVITMILLSSLALVSALHYLGGFYKWIYLTFVYLPGSRRRSLIIQTNFTRHIVLYGQNIYGDIFLRNVNQILGPWIQSLLHERLVLAGFHHRNGE